MSMIAAVIGTPISHSLSPAIHNAAFAAAHRDGEYMAVECGLNDVEVTMSGLQADGLVGLSVSELHFFCSFRVNWSQHRW